MKTAQFSSVFVVFIFQFFALSNFCTAQPTGKSIVLDGITDYVNIPDNSSLDLSSAITVEAWIKPCEVSGVQMIVSKLWCSGALDAFYLGISNGELVWHWDSDGACVPSQANRYASSSAIIVEKQWQHVAVVHTTTGITLYYNGSPVSGTLTNGSFGSIFQNSEPMRIGTYRFLSGSYGLNFRGRIDEFRVWDLALSGNDIQNRWNTTLTGSETGLVAYYDMEVSGIGNGTLLPNNALSTGAVNNGTLVGSGATPFFLHNSIALDSLNLGDSITVPIPGVLLTAAGSGIQYAWQDGSIDSTFMVTATGWYWVDATIGTCTIRDSVFVTLEQPFVYGNNNGSYGLEPASNSAEVGLSIYPTLVRSYLNLKLENADQLVGIQFKVFDCLGRMVLSEAMENLPLQEVDVSNLAPGMYHYRVSSRVGLLGRGVIFKE